MNTKTDVDVIIDSKRYTLSGYESSEYLQKIAAYINDKISEFKAQEGYTHLTTDMKHILLAINLADDYYKSREAADDLQKEKEDLEKEIFEMKHELIDIREQLSGSNDKVNQLEAEKTESENKVIRLEAELEASKEMEKTSAQLKDKRHERKR